MRSIITIFSLFPLYWMYTDYCEPLALRSNDANHSLTPPPAVSARAPRQAQKRLCSRAPFFIFAVFLIARSFIVTLSQRSHWCVYRPGKTTPLGSFQSFFFYTNFLLFYFTELRTRMCDMANEILSAFETENITYWLVGGSALGAAREGNNSLFSKTLPASSHSFFLEAHKKTLFLLQK